MTRTGIHDEEVRFDGAHGDRLAGTLILPEGARGTVVFVHGSGPLDRDQNAGAQKLNIFNALAADLAVEGYATLRYDKRGCGASGGDYQTLGYDDLVADVRAAVGAARARVPGPVWLCGHSEGTTIAPRAAAGLDGVAGLILICPFLTPGQEILLWQAAQVEREIAAMRGFGGLVARLATRLFGGPVRMQARLLTKVASTDAPVIRFMGRKQGVRWLRDFLEQDAGAIHRANSLPTLVIGAAKDAQCPPADSPRIAEISGRASLVMIDDLTHILRRSDQPPGVMHYREELKHPIDPRVAAAMLDWLAGEGADQPGSAEASDEGGPSTLH